MTLPMPDLSAWLVATKLSPPLMRGEIIRRGQLEEALCRSVSTLPVTLLSAPAGYGKTTLLATLPHLVPDLPLAWVTLDAEDNDPGRFAGLLGAALQRLHPACGRSVWPWLTAGGADTSTLKQAMGALIADVLTLLPDPFILVLDDLHTVTEPAVYVALEYLLEHQPPQLHLALGTRHDPPLRLARLAARRQLGELRRPDLGFSPDEAHHLLNETLGLRLAPTEVAALQERTEGWPAGLCLLAGPLGRLDAPAGRSQFLAAVSQSERYVFDFLASEVLRDLDEDMRLFLLRTSVLDDMTPSACRAVTGREDAGDVLERLYRQNLTIASLAPGPRGEPVYRHHALFARLLARQLERELPGEVALLHSRAARAEATPGRAIAHYLSAGLWAEAAELMARAGLGLLHSGMSETIRHWYSRLPHDARQGNPRLTLLMGACELHRGDYAAAGRLYEQARAAFAAAGDQAGEGEALAASITMACQENDREAAAAAVQRALQLPLSPMGQMRILLTRAWLQLWEGDWAAIGDHVRAALAIPRTANVPQADLVGVTYMSVALAAVPGCLAPTEHYCDEAIALAPPDTAWRLGADELSVWPLLWRGKPDEALARAEAAETLRQRLGGFPFVGTDLAVQLAILYLARGDTEAAGRAVDRLVARLAAASKSKRAFYLHAAGRAMALLGRPAEAQALLERLDAARDGLPLTDYLYHHLTGLLALLLSRRTDAGVALERAAQLEEQLPIAWVGGSARLLRARLLLEQGRPDLALAAVVPVLTEWERRGTPGCALLDGPAGLPALRLAARSGIAAAAHLVALFPDQQAPKAEPAPAHPAAGALPEPLTQRECDVLRLIVAGRSNPQIGAALYITAETVKTHVAHILRKLEVTSRTEAATRGRELGF